MVEKATTQQKGPCGPPSEFRDPLVTRCGRGSPHSIEWASGPPVEQQENEKDTTLMTIRVGVNILQSLFSLQLPLTVKPFRNFQIK